MEKELLELEVERVAVHDKFNELTGEYKTYEQLRINTKERQEQERIK